MLQYNDISTKKNLDYVNHIWMAIMKMNTSWLHHLLDDTIQYEDIGKVKFIEKLNNHFNSFTTLGDNELYLDLDYCMGCNCNLPVCRFVGNHSGSHFALYFEFEERAVKDIYHCNWYGDSDIDFLF